MSGAQNAVRFERKRYCRIIAEVINAATPLLRASMKISHRWLPHTEEGGLRVTAILSEEFGPDGRQAVIEASPTFGVRPAVWHAAAAHGSHGAGYAVLIVRNSPTEVEAILEMTAGVRVDDACQNVYGALLSAFGSNGLKLRPSLKRLEVTSQGDTRPLLIGRQGLLNELMARERRVSLLASVVFLVVLAILSFIWVSEARSLWAGNAALAATILASVVDTWLLAHGRRIRWYPVE